MTPYEPTRRVEPAWVTVDSGLWMCVSVRRLSTAVPRPGASASAADGVAAVSVRSTDVWLLRPLRGGLGERATGLDPVDSGANDRNAP